MDKQLRIIDELDKQAENEGKALRYHDYENPKRMTMDELWDYQIRKHQHED